MPVHDQILALQHAQLRHDERYHRDILLLSVSDRMKHFTLHFAKYVGYLVEALDQNDQDQYKKVLVDAFIIGLASANTLNIDLGKLVDERREPMPEDLHNLGRAIRRELGRPEDDRMWIVKQLARQTARLSKACESLDHVESYPYRTVMEDAVVGLFKIILAEQSEQYMDISKLSTDRLSGVENRNIFHTFYT